jgi:hypothetical protein
MRLSTRVASAAVAVALAASPALAQRPGGGGRGGLQPMSPLQLLSQQSVQEELKLTPEQKKTVEDASAKQMAARRSLNELEGEERAQKAAELNKQSEKIVDEVLKPEQAKRLKQIRLQQQGIQAFEDPAVVKELKLTADQEQKVKALHEEIDKLRQGVRQQGGGGGREEVMKKMQELNKQLTDRAVALLTDEQKTKWKEMTGEPFKGEIRRPGRPGGASP